MVARVQQTARRVPEARAPAAVVFDWSEGLGLERQRFRAGLYVGAFGIQCLSLLEKRGRWVDTHSVNAIRADSDQVEP